MTTLAMASFSATLRDAAVDCLGNVLWDSFCFLGKPQHLGGRLFTGPLHDALSFVAASGLNPTKPLQEHLLRITEPIAEVSC